MTKTHPLPPKISDRELLSIICQLGRAATEASIRHSINERIGREVSYEWVRERLDQIEAAGLLVTYRPTKGVPYIRLTALGIEGLGT